MYLRSTTRTVRLFQPCYTTLKRQYYLSQEKQQSLPETNQNLRTSTINEAEKVVGYPTSFLSLRWVLNDEVANVALHIRKLLGTNHPLLKTARELLLGRHRPTWGLIVLLISKAGGIKSDFSEVDCDITAGILHSQRVLAEITEMMKTSNIIHKSLQNIDKSNIKDADDINYGNKLALLTGDYLLSTCFRELAVLKNQEVNELVSTALRDLTEAEFLGPRDLQNRALPAPPDISLNNETVNIPNEYGSEPYRIDGILGNAKAEWTLRNLLGGGTLLAKCCQGSLKLGGHTEELQKYAYLVGRNMALAWQLRIEQESITSYDKYSPFNLTCAPVLFHLQSEPKYYKVISNLGEDVDFSSIRQTILSGPGLEKTQELQEEFVELALSALNKFPESSATNALKNIIKAM